MSMSDTQNISMDKFKYDAFISFSSDDMPFVQRLHERLQKDGIRCFFSGVSLYE